MIEGLDFSPITIGSIPQWGMFFLLLIAVVRVSPQWIDSLIKAASEKRTGVANRIRELEQAIDDCRADCDKETALLRDIIDALKHKINNEAQQRVQSEISLVSTLIQIVDAPQLKQILKALESRAMLLTLVEQLNGPLGDTEGAGNEVDNEGA